MPAGNAVLNTLYSTVMKRNSTYVLCCLTGAFFGEKVVTGVGDGIWASANRGTRWVDIKDNLPVADDDDE